MLVLARKVGERILIGDQIAVTVVKVGPGGVRIGVEAPPELAVVREELAEQIAAELGEQAEVNAELISARVHPSAGSNSTADADGDHSAPAKRPR